jgi:translation initiation factor IF-1
LTAGLKGHTVSRLFLNQAAAGRTRKGTMSRTDHIELDGVVEEVLAGGMFRVRLDSGLVVLSHLAGKMRKYRIRIVLGDQVRVAVSPYDPSRGRIIYRLK